LDVDVDVVADADVRALYPLARCPRRLFLARLRAWC
jgi:hypothetical protein